MPALHLLVLHLPVPKAGSALLLLGHPQRPSSDGSVLWILHPTGWMRPHVRSACVHCFAGSFVGTCGRPARLPPACGVAMQAQLACQYAGSTTLTCGPCVLPIALRSPHCTLRAASKIAARGGCVPSRLCSPHPSLPPDALTLRLRSCRGCGAFALGVRATTGPHRYPAAR